MDVHIVVVGAGLAGLTAAARLRERGYTGRLTVVGAERHRPYDRIPLSKGLLAGTVGPAEVALPAAAGLDVTWRLGDPAVSLDLAGRRVLLAGGDRLRYDGLVIATGARPRALPLPTPARGVFALRTLDDGLALRAALDRARRVVVVGAGLVGAEVAATCRQQGRAVTLVDPAPAPLFAACGPAVGGYLADLHRREGVRVRLGTGVTAFHGRRAVRAVTLAGPGPDHRPEREVVAADLVVVAVGADPDTAWLSTSGLALATSGPARSGGAVVCDEYLRAAPRVVAAGDVARWPSRRFGTELTVGHWDNAVAQGAAAADSLLAELSGGRPSDGPTAPSDAALFGAEPFGVEPFDALPFFSSEQYGQRIQAIGLPGDETRLVSGSYVDGRFVALQGRAGRIVGAVAVNHPAGLMRCRNLVESTAPWPPSRDCDDPPEPTRPENPADVDSAVPYRTATP